MSDALLLRAYAVQQVKRVAGWSFPIVTVFRCRTPVDAIRTKRAIAGEPHVERVTVTVTVSTL